MSKEKNPTRLLHGDFQDLQSHSMLKGSQLLHVGFLPLILVFRKLSIYSEEQERQGKHEEICIGNIENYSKKYLWKTRIRP